MGVFHVDDSVSRHSSGMYQLNHLMWKQFIRGDLPAAIVTADSMVEVAKSLVQSLEETNTKMLLPPPKTERVESEIPEEVNEQARKSMADLQIKIAASIAEFEKQVERDNNEKRTANSSDPSVRVKPIGQDEPV